MVETTCSPAVRDRYDRFRAGRRHQPRRSHRTAFVLSTVAIAAAAGYVTFSLPVAVADARSVAMTTIQAFLGPWLGTVRRAPVEDAANVLLLLPVAVLASLALTRRSRLPPSSWAPGRRWR